MRFSDVITTERLHAVYRELYGPRAWAAAETRTDAKRIHGPQWRSTASSST